MKTDGGGPASSKGWHYFFPMRSTIASNIIMNTMTNISKVKLGTRPSIISVMF